VTAPVTRFRSRWRSWCPHHRAEAFEAAPRIDTLKERSRSGSASTRKAAPTGAPTPTRSVR
jgi:hypothetical protein